MSKVLSGFSKVILNGSSYRLVSLDSFTDSGLAKNVVPTAEESNYYLQANFQAGEVSFTLVLDEVDIQDFKDGNSLNSLGSIVFQNPHKTLSIAEATLTMPPTTDLVNGTISISYSFKSASTTNN